MLTIGELNLIDEIVRKEYKITTMEELEEREYYRRRLIRKMKKLKEENRKKRITQTRKRLRAI